MPWLDFAPTAEDLAFWFMPNGAPHKVSRWPRPNTARVDCRVRLSRQLPPFENVLTRQLVRFQQWLPPGNDGRPPDKVRYWWGDYTPFAIDELRMFSDVDTDGFFFESFIISAPAMTQSGQPGVELFTFEQADNGFTAEDRNEWLLNGARPYRWNVDTEAWPAEVQDYNHFGNYPYWDETIDFWGFSDCYEFPRVSGDFPVGASVITNQLIANDNDTFADVTLPPGFSHFKGVVRLRGGTLQLPGCGIQFGRNGVVDTGAADYRWKSSNYATSGNFNPWGNVFAFGIDRANLVPRLNEVVNKWFVGKFDIIGPEDDAETAFHAICGGDGAFDRYSVLLGYHKFEEQVDTVRLFDYQSSQGWAAGSKFTLIGYN